MTFGTVLTVVLIGYALYYGGLVIHDLFFDKSGVVEAIAMEEEEIDISDEAQNFSPIEISREQQPRRQDADMEEDDTTSMSGGIAIDDLLAGANDLAVNGEESELGKVCALWSVGQ